MSEAWAWIIIGGIFVAFIIYAGREGAKLRKRQDERLAAFRAEREGWEIFVADSQLDPSLLAVGAASKQISVGTVDAYIDVPWIDICRVEIESNDTSLTTTNRGSQLLGGVVGNVLLGPMGLLIGGLTASKSTRQRINDLTLKIIVEHPSRPSHKVVFFRKGGKGLKPRSLRLRAPAERLDHFHALLLNAMRSAERDRIAPTAPMATASLEQSLEKLWQLHQAGALTEAEFGERKQRLLAGH